MTMSHQAHITSPNEVENARVETDYKKLHNKNIEVI